MEIKVEFKGLLRESSKSQGMKQCIGIILLFSFSMYLHGLSFQIFCRAALSAILICANMWIPTYKHTIVGILMYRIQWLMWIIIIPVLLGIGILYAPILYYSALEIILYFQLIYATPEIFTAGETFINSFLITTLYYFCAESQALSTSVVYLPWKVTLMLFVVYFVFASFLGRGETLNGFSVKTLILTVFFVSIALIFQTIKSENSLSSEVQVHIKELGELVFPRLRSLSSGFATFTYLLWGTKLKIIVFVYSLMVTFVGMYFYSRIKEYFNFGLILSRKYFHLLGFVLFAPGFVLDPVVVLVALNFAISLTLILDLLRLKYSSSSKIFHTVGNYYNKFSPRADHWKFNWAPISLLGGCVIPLNMLYFMGNGSITKLDQLFASSAVCFLTIGDSFNAIIGSKCGKTVWKGTNKTVVGTISCIVFSLLAMLLFILLLEIPLSSSIFIKVFASVVLMSFLETFTSQNDNFIVTIFFFSLLLTFNYFLQP